MSTDIRSSASGDTTWSMAVDLKHEDDALVLRAHIPGLTADEVKVDVEAGVVTVTGAHEDRTDSEDHGVSRHERRYGAFRRTFTLPGEQAGDPQVTAKDDGVEITIPLRAS